MDHEDQEVYFGHCTIGLGTNVVWDSLQHNEDRHGQQKQAVAKTAQRFCSAPAICHVARAVLRYGGGGKEKEEGCHGDKRRLKKNSCVVKERTFILLRSAM